MNWKKRKRCCRNLDLFEASSLLLLLLSPLTSHRLTTTKNALFSHSSPPLPHPVSPEAKQAATERQRQHVKESKFIKRISRLVPASWLSGNGGNGGSSDASRGKYKPAPPASGSEDATGGFGGGGGGSGSGSGSGVGAAAGPPGVEKKE